MLGLLRLDSPTWLLLSIAIFCAFLALSLAAGLFFRKHHGKTARRLTVLLCISVLSAIGSIVTGSLRAPPVLKLGDIPELKQQGSTILDRIEAFRVSSGQLPASLSDLQLSQELTDTEYGAFKYERSHDQESFRLWIGNYTRNLFVLSWDSSRGTWELDS